MHMEKIKKQNLKTLGKIQLSLKKSNQIKQNEHNWLLSLLSAQTLGSNQGGGLSETENTHNSQN